MNLRRLLKTALLLASLPTTLGFAGSVFSETEITVGVYDFPPVAAIDDDQRVDGLLSELLAELESAHQDIDFRIVHTSPKRRHLDFEAGLYDVIFFESLDWGWESQPVEATRPLLQDEEVYVALDKPGRDQSFFDDITAHNIAVISGYHYGFADMSTDDAELEERFRVEFSHSHERNLKVIKADRPSVAEIAIIGRSYLEMHLQQHPEDRDRFLVSDTVDQVYRLRILAREDGPLSAERLEQMLWPLIENGRYQEMVKRHGLKLPNDLAGR
ncbi:transporter substrate-binding domain-containing protein [Marinobacter sp. HL-58]|uniref:transporter substrate-binding domain-containing protein n=1 Tax=Marinobacter sp. HL-58 TaxID=1479237 RepID=UPI00047FBC8A|nr:transporter substrate-binding domain-containing protein [Marinobacter sp. HL-58]KPP96899.1 MAG: amino acid ABC transporter substrate-binding protein, PAAT family [Marinobacter sp. HL-58]